jgi:hypothetical protein
MRIRLMPTTRRSPSHGLGVDYDRLVFDRALLLWVHSALGLAAALMYFSTFDHSHLRWWGRVGTYLVLQPALAWIPYESARWVVEDL